MDIKVTRFGYGWAWVGFFAISRPSRNNFEGQVPTGLAALGGLLQVLDLGENLLSGVLHTALFDNLTSLHLLDLSRNQFLDSKLPRELGV